MPNLVLLVEDDTTLRTLGQLQLNHLGLSSHLAKDGLQAVQLASANKYAVILMDIGLPEMDGVTATMLIRENELKSGSSRVTIIALTAYDNILEHSAGIDDYLRKPVLLKQLKATMQKWSIIGAD